PLFHQGLAKGTTRTSDTGSRFTFTGGATWAWNTGCKGFTFTRGGTGASGWGRINLYLSSALFSNRLVYCSFGLWAGWLGYFGWVGPDFGLDFGFSLTYNSERCGQNLGGAVSVVKASPHFYYYNISSFDFMSTKYSFFQHRGFGDTQPRGCLWLQAF
ncbi:30675_t:CDS:2, partial [Racocetra persica]